MPAVNSAQAQPEKGMRQVAEQLYAILKQKETHHCFKKKQKCLTAIKINDENSEMSDIICHPSNMQQRFCPKPGMFPNW
jgi:hypothetical protein